VQVAENGGKYSETGTRVKKNESCASVSDANLKYKRVKVGFFKKWGD
jgi:hypothetical protein